MGLVETSQLLTHIVGFIIVLAVLKRYAWGPMLKMLDDRRERIRSELEAAERERLEAERTREELQRSLKEIDATARARTLEAINEARKIASEIKENARNEGKALIERARREIEREKAKAQIELRNTVVGLAVLGAEKLMSERMDEEHNRRLVREFIERMESKDKGRDANRPN